MASSKIARVLYDFVNSEALPGTGVSPDRFWAGAERIIQRLCAEEPRAGGRTNRAAGARSTTGTGRAAASRTTRQYRAFLADIGYLVPEGEDFASPPPMSTTRSPASPAPSSSCR
jgi:malate synthase